MCKTTMILKMQGYWAVGSGKGGGKEVDSRIDRDADGLPYIPGKMLKGLIKDACLRLEKTGSKKYNFVKNVFGGQEDNKSNGLNRTATLSGKIYISDARLSPAIRQKLKEKTDLKDNLTRSIYSTAINNETGTADEQSLRGYEVAVPMELYAVMECECEKEIFDSIKIAAKKLVYTVGSHKSRGLGEVVIEFKDEV
ncbi:MAG: hypothetical protein IKQ61_08970 [Spirochaetales bacterium]|nr:hypothetical protein [Spirochaetales bacterium]